MEMIQIMVCKSFNQRHDGVIIQRNPGNVLVTEDARIYDLLIKGLVIQDLDCKNEP